MLKCITCREEKDLVEFRKVRGEGYGQRCTDCRKRVSETTKKWFSEYSPEYKRRRQKYKYRRDLRGLTEVEFQKMQTDQGFKCAICDEAKPLVIDHCHASGQVRGLLCGLCNSGIGFLRDSVSTLEAAIRYLQR